jgi:hypothetical protein
MGAGVARHLTLQHFLFIKAFLDPMSVCIGAARPTLRVVNEGWPLARAYPQRRRTDG